MSGLPGPVGSPTLLARVVRELQAGPRHTLELARDALGLSGNPRLAARTVFALLADDVRFRVDEAGAWSLAGANPAGQAGPALRRLSCAVVDVETTGGSFRGGHRVTEVAVVHVDDGKVSETWESLVNPERPIPPRIQRLTGITDEMVAGAPSFEEVAGEVARRLDRRVFVAHNAGFDWRFVSGELERSRRTVPAMQRLCTVRMGRVLVPGLGSHALDPLVGHFGITVAGRHRAGGDARATAELLLRLFGEAEALGLGSLDALEARLASRTSRRSRRERVPRNGAADHD